MVLAKPRSGVTVFLEDFANGSVFLTDHRVITRIAGRHFADDAITDRVVIAAGDERRPRRRAESGGMELRVAQPRFGDTVHGRRRDDTAEVPETP